MENEWLFCEYYWKFKITRLWKHSLVTLLTEMTSLLLPVSLACYVDWMEYWVHQV